MGQSKPEQIISTYVDLLVDNGVKQATIDAVAKRAGLSKAGLLHHFHSRTELDSALVTHLRELVTEDIALMRESPLGAAHYYLSSSFDAGSELERAVVAVTRLSQAGNNLAGETLRWARDLWYSVLNDELADPLLSRFVLLAGDGVSYHTDIEVPDPAGSSAFISPTDIAAFAQLIEQLRSRSNSSKTPRS